MQVQLRDRTIKLDSIMCHRSSCRRRTKSKVDYDYDYDYFRGLLKVQYQLDLAANARRKMTLKSEVHKGSN